MVEAQPKRILIADEDFTAVKSLRIALEQRGYSVSVAENGPRALEAAIETRPDLVVASCDLPLIDGPRLAGIIRVNPNTQGALFIFLAAQPGPLRARTGFREEVVQKPCNQEELVAMIDRFFKRSERILQVSSLSDAGIQGDLSQIPLADLLQVFHLNRRTGTLLLTEPGAPRSAGQGFIYLKEGETINALLGHIEGEKALHRMLDWRAGRFEFIPDQAVTELRIRTPLHSLVMEHARQADEWAKLRADLPRTGAELRLKARVASLPPGVHPLTQEVLLLLEFHSRIEEIVDNCSAPDFQVYRTLHTLIRKGIVEVAQRSPEGPSAERPGASWLSPDQIDRLREKIAPRGMPPWGRTFGKLLVFVPEAGAGEALLGALGGIGGVTIHKRGLGVGPADDGADPFPAFASWQLSANVSLRLMQVPAGNLHRPLWPLLARGAIGGLFVLDASRTDSVDAVKPLNDFFQDTHPLPVGYLVLAEEAVQADVKARLSSTLPLRGNDALFMLPREQASKIPTALKRFVEQIIMR
jgi:CheY-like chemotaxis protein